jgi:hypothetical protein
MTGDGNLDAADVIELVQNTYGTRLGDFNLDGAVDGADRTVFNAQFGTTLDGRDFLDFQQNFGFSNMPPAGAVPEPATALLAVAGLGALYLRRRRTPA